MYVRRELPQAHINVADVSGRTLECRAVTVRLRDVDTTVGSITPDPSPSSAEQADPRAPPSTSAWPVKKTGFGPPADHLICGREGPKDQAMQYSRLARFLEAASRRPGGSALPGSGSSSSARGDHVVQGAKTPSCARPLPPELTGCEAQG
ncbi:hypothetical protein MTO96_048714 [Rhipicephalus appendiculatus]